MWKVIPWTFTVAFTVSLVACDGGGGEEKEKAIDPHEGVLIFGPCGNVPNYSSAIGPTRWKRFPVTVSIDLSAAPRANEGNNRNIYLRAIRAGASGWATAGGGIGLVQFVEGPADIAIAFSNSLPSQVLGGTLNAVPYTRYQQRGTTINLSVQAFFNLSQTVVFEQAVQEVTLHEMGHALFSSGGSNGGHSPYPGDIMFGPVDSVVPTQRDINTIREAYCKRLPL